MGWQPQELEPRSPAPPLPQEHKEVIAGSTAFTLGTAPTVTHTLPAWWISDLRNTVPTPHPPAVSVLTLRSLITSLACLKTLGVSVPRSPARERTEF